MEVKLRTQLSAGSECSFRSRRRVEIGRKLEGRTRGKTRAFIPYARDVKDARLFPTRAREKTRVYSLRALSPNSRSQYSDSSACYGGLRVQYYNN